MIAIRFLNNLIIIPPLLLPTTPFPSLPLASNPFCALLTSCFIIAIIVKTNNSIIATPTIALNVLTKVSKKFLFPETPNDLAYSV